MKIVQYIIADSKTSVERLENSIEYRVYSGEKKENKRFISWLLTNRRTGVSPVYAKVGVRFIEPVSGRINPTPTRDRKEKGNIQNISIG